MVKSATKKTLVKKSKAKQPVPINKRSRRNLFVALSALVVLLLVLGAGLLLRHPAEQLTADGPLSRQVSVYQQSIIKQYPPGPVMAALQYAYVSSAYYDALKAGDQADALAAAGSMLSTIYPAQAHDISEHIASLAAKNKVEQKSIQSGSPLEKIINTYTVRYTNDGHTLAWDGVIPSGQGKWTKVSAGNPISPRAGDWKTWNVNQPIAVSPPPVYGSAEDARQLAIVQRAVASRNGEDVNIINFWAGGLGTETPSGIWQNQLFRTVQSGLPANAVLADKSYALIQKNLTQTISDAFIQCWKVKYIYWTARPSMRIPTLVTAMNDPTFPSYISGHSTISKAAADVLSVMVPKYQQQWEAMAVQARDSRLKAGIHFEADNIEGFKVGTNVAQQTIAAAHLRAVE
jgi:hypothetical protein